jgi:hypothetical protein
MRGGLEHLREQHPGMWLLIRLDGPEAEAGTLLAASPSPERVDEALAQHFDLKTSDTHPLYVTYALPAGEDLPAFAL